MHSLENSKHLFPEVKLCGLVSIFYIHVSGMIYIFPWLVFFGISIFLYCVQELSAQPQERREGQGTATSWLAAVPCPLLCFCIWAESSHKWPTYIFPVWKIMDHKRTQLILVVNFLFGLRVNEITNKTFYILDSHQPFICSVDCCMGIQAM